MTWVEGLVLGAIQGVTEFLPVSSSGHLEIGKALFGGTSSGSESLLVTTVLHVGTALSTIIVFRRTIAELLKGIFKFSWNDETKFVAFIILSMIPAAIVGVFFNDWLEGFFDGRLIFVGCMLIMTAILLFFADRAKETERRIGWVEAIIIGISQAIATLPGISRSGATISTSVILGIDKEKAASFSFLMVVPLILGQVCKDLLSIAQGDFHETIAFFPLFVGFLSAFITGLFACIWMIKLVKKSKLIYFSYYCFIIGLIVIICRFFQFF